MSLIEYAIRKLSKESWQFREIMDDIITNPDTWLLDNQSELGSFKLLILQKDVAVKADYIEIWIQDKPRVVGLRNCFSYKGLRAGENFNLKEEHILKETIKTYRKIRRADSKSDGVRRMKLRERLLNNYQDIESLNDVSRANFEAKNS